MIGHYRSKLDDKGRVIIPSKLRKELGGSIVVSFDLGNTLTIRSEKEFKAYQANITSQPIFSSDARKLHQMLSFSEVITLDNKGRANMPKTLLDLAKMEGEIVFGASGSYVRLYTTEQFDKVVEQMLNGELDAAAESIYERNN